MLKRPTPEFLHDATKDELIVLIEALFDHVESLTLRIEHLEAENQQLKNRLALNSKNSSIPPSKNRNPIKPAYPREKGKNSNGGQPGHGGNTLRKVATSMVDIHIEHRFGGGCTSCGKSMDKVPVHASDVLTRQVFDIPSPAFLVTEHHVMRSICACGQVHVGSFPEDIIAQVQYGPRIKAEAVALNSVHMIPLARTAEILNSRTGLSLSEASIHEFVNKAVTGCESVVDMIANLCREAEVLHVDETGMSINGKTHWAHVAATPKLTHMSAQIKRGMEGILGTGVIVVMTDCPKTPQTLQQVLIHDGLLAYKSLPYTHALCNAHHVRELRFVQEQLGQPWARDMIDLLQEACAESKETPSPTAADRVASYLDRFNSIMMAGFASNPKNHVRTGLRGRPAQNKAFNLLTRLQQYSDDVWRFLTDKRVPFSNNIAERAMRMPKVKMKVAGCFRTLEGFRAFCVLRSYIDTMKKQGHTAFAALFSVFNGDPLAPQAC